jgi:hypothetical protein
VTLLSRHLRLLAFFVSGISILSCAHTAPVATHHHDAELGAVHLPIMCTPDAQRQFDHALALFHHMTYPEARQAFERVAATDSRCAMAHWGIAMTLFQPLWPTRPSADDLQRGSNEVRTARELGTGSERERLFVDAAAAFFDDAGAPDYWQRIARWESASESAYNALPGDPEAAVFYALAHLATTPATRITREHADRAAAILLRVYERNPSHPGAMHYLVHANDVPGRERELLEITRKYESLAPRNPHALHMPTHIYTRLGDWDGVIRGNLLAADAALEHPAGSNGEFVWDEFAHAIEYLVYAYLQKGDYASAGTQLRRLHETKNLQPTFKTAFHLASTQARFALERHAWSEAAALPLREPANLNWDKFTWAEAITVFARGLGSAHLDDLKASRESAERLTELEKSTRAAGEELFARNIRVLNLELNAWIAHVEHRTEESRRLMQEAVELEGATPKHAVTPAPTVPALEFLGDLLLEQGANGEALDAYTRASAAYPHRYNSAAGAERAKVAW